MKLNDDVKEVISWGLDVYTCRNILDTLPTNMNYYAVYDFIIYKLNYSQLQLGENGWDMAKGLKLILNSEPESPIYTENDRELARVLMDCY